MHTGYIQMSSAALGEGGVLPARIRKVIAPAIALNTECDGCIAAHARGAARQGATAQEVAQALGEAIAINGGPGTVWAPRAYAAFREFAGESSCWCGRSGSVPPLH